MMKNYGESVEINHKLNWPYIYNHPYSIWIIGGSGSGNWAHVLLSSVKRQRPENDKKLFLCQKSIPFESMYHLLISTRRKVGSNYGKIPKAFIDYSQTVNEIYENTRL